MSNTNYRLPQRIFDLYYGQPGTSKSEAVARVAEIATQSGKKARFIIGDGSAPTYEHLVLDGRAELMEFTHRDYPTKTLRRLAEGWWPADLSDPHSPLLPPDHKDNHILDACLNVFEGLSVGGRYILGMNKGGHAWRAAQGEKLGPDPVVRYIDGDVDKLGKPIEDDSAFGTNGTAHYMAAQQQMVEIVQTSRSLPSHVIWTAHEAVAEQQTNIGDLKNPVKLKTGDTIIGPEVAGKALTPIIQRVFGDTLHFQTLAKKVKQDKADSFTGAAGMDLDLDFRLWTRDHFALDGQSQLRYRACVRGVGATFPQWFSSVEPGIGILDFYKTKCDIRDSKMIKKEDNDQG